MNRAPADSAPSPPPVAGASLGLIRRRKNAEPRKDKASAAIANGALSACTSRPPRLGPPTKEKARLAVHQRRALHVLAGGHDGHRDRAVAGREQRARHPRPERDRVQLGQREHAQGVADGNAGEQGRPADIGGDHENPAAAEPVGPGPGVHGEQQAGQPDGGGQVAHLGGTARAARARRSAAARSRRPGRRTSRSSARSSNAGTSARRAAPEPARPAARGGPRCLGPCFRFRGGAHRPGSSRSAAPERSPGKARCR